MINLAIADLFFVVTNLPLAIYNTIYGDWMFDKAGKKFLFIKTSNSIAVVLN
jgi:hypothetical protein